MCNFIVITIFGAWKDHLMEQEWPSVGHVFARRMISVWGLYNSDVIIQELF